jgi:nitrite reductase/ring-hydroxylating ferredoxin subunit
MFRLDARRLRNLIAFSMVFLIGVGVGFGIAQLKQQPELIVSLGAADHFPPGSVTELGLPAAFFDSMHPPSGLQAPNPIGWVSPVPIFLVHDPAVGFLAFYNRDTHSSCRIRWVESSQRFEDPCHGSKYTRTGKYMEGPAPRGLDRFQVTVTGQRIVEIDISKFQLGPPYE